MVLFGTHLLTRMDSRSKKQRNREEISLKIVSRNFFDFAFGGQMKWKVELNQWYFNLIFEFLGRGHSHYVDSSWMIPKQYIQFFSLVSQPDLLSIYKKRQRVDRIVVRLKSDLFNVYCLWATYYTKLTDTTFDITRPRIETIFI